MADNEPHKKLPDKKLYNPRKNPALRPPPGVQKALQNFGVPDLREFLDKKHREQGSSPEDKPVDPRKQPPPDPSYNYLKDPSRELPGSSPKPDETPQRQFNQRKSRSHQYNNNNNEGYPDSKDSYSDKGPKGTVKKELRFSDAPQVLEGVPQISGRSRGNFRGRNPRGRGKHIMSKDREVIENPVNIKVQLRVDSGQRSCTLDEETKIAEIKHVPDWTSGGQKAHRGYFRGSRGSFRRGRRRGNFHGERPTNDNKTDEEYEAAPLTVNNSTPEEQTEVDENRQDSLEQEEYVDSSENYEEFSTQSITITSTKLQDGKVKRSVDTIGAEGTMLKMGEIPKKVDQ
ncbi:uncharacterized protein [Euwallacea fornicatus]|uniref:uncharacterized protein n=1 Tax=Euwallacea fornicatus TaxID=995702 RepID=UPI00338F2293